jgi:hypothetical protein
MRTMDTGVPTASFCPRCGTPAVPGDTFCGNCGGSLARAGLTGPDAEHPIGSSAEIVDVASKASAPSQEPTIPLELGPPSPPLEPGVTQPANPFATTPAGPATGPRNTRALGVAASIVAVVIAGVLGLALTRSGGLPRAVSIPTASAGSSVQGATAPTPTFRSQTPTRPPTERPRVVSFKDKTVGFSLSRRFAGIKVIFERVEKRHTYVGDKTIHAKRGKALLVVRGRALGDQQEIVSWIVSTTDEYGEDGPSEYGFFGFDGSINDRAVWVFSVNAGSHLFKLVGFPGDAHVTLPRI